MSLSFKRRSRRGASTLILMTFFTVFGALLVGMAAFEFARYSLACQEFNHCVDAACLGGSAGLASSNSLDPVTSHTIAVNTAKWVFEQNTMMGKSLAGKATYNMSSSAPSTPAAENATLNFCWLDPQTGNPTADPAAQKVLRVMGAYGYKPLVGEWIGLGKNASLGAASNGYASGPMLDVVLCFDLSGSIDDSTKVTCVWRYWVPPSGKNQYRIVNPNGNGTLYDVTGATNLTGSAVNACYPQALEAASGSGGYGNLDFRENMRGQTQGSRPTPTTPENGKPWFTDMVVNLDENDVFAGYTIPAGTYAGYDFPTVGALVEASRGNLESLAIANAAGVDLTAIGVTNPRAGYYQAYWQEALKHRHPLYDAQASTANFYTMMNNSIDAHFGFIGFSSDENTTYSDQAVSGAHPSCALSFPMQLPSGPIPTTNTVSTPIKYTQPDPTPGTAFSQYSTIMAYMPPLNPPANPQLTANGGTDIVGALDLAMANLFPAGSATSTDKWPSGLNRSRNGATRAIVLFTDGLPTADTSPNFSNSTLPLLATYAKNHGVKIYCIGLAQIPELVGPMNSTLAPIATNSGGKFYSIPPGTNQAAALDRAFQDIARSLVALVK
ncbi:MAG TPA: vWA domain-containing protein [Candidatus Obscuribacterales bacterium]